MSPAKARAWRGTLTLKERFATWWRLHAQTAAPFSTKRAAELNDDDLENMGIEGCLAMAIYAPRGNLG